MKNEIRGLPAGIFHIDDTARFVVQKCDSGTVITLSDHDLGIAYTVIVNEKGEVVLGGIETPEDALGEE